MGWVGSSYQGTSLEVLFMGVFLGSSLLFASGGVGGPILVDGTCQVTGNPYGFHGYRGGCVWWWTVLSRFPVLGRF